MEQVSIIARSRVRFLGWCHFIWSGTGSVGVCRPYRHKDTGTLPLDFFPVGLYIDLDQISRFGVGLQGLFDVLILLYFVNCGVSRLARYNATAEAKKDASGKVAYFEGTPIRELLRCYTLGCDTSSKQARISTQMITRSSEVICLWLISLQNTQS